MINTDINRNESILMPESSHFPVSLCAVLAGTAQIMRLIRASTATASSPLYLRFSVCLGTSFLALYVLEHRPAVHVAAPPVIRTRSNLHLPSAYMLICFALLSGDGVHSNRSAVLGFLVKDPKTLNPNMRHNVIIGR